jgi:hypothetical protein
MTREPRNGENDDQHVTIRRKRRRRVSTKTPADDADMEEVSQHQSAGSNSSAPPQVQKEAVSENLAPPNDARNEGGSHNKYHAKISANECIFPAAVMEDSLRRVPIAARRDCNIATPKQTKSAKQFMDWRSTLSKKQLSREWPRALLIDCSCDRQPQPGA